MGKHKNPRRHLSGTPEQWAAWADAAGRSNQSLTAWIQSVCDKAARRAKRTQDSAKRVSPVTDPRQVSLLP